MTATVGEYVIFASYGNDSIALLQWMAERGHTDATAVFSDTGWAAEGWLARVDRAEEWARSLGFRTVRLASEGMEALAKRKKACPRGGGGKFQFCTGALKKEPAVAWLAQADPDGEVVCVVGIRREESANRAQFPEWTEESPEHGGRSLWAPLVRHDEVARDALIARTPFAVLPHRSRECYPCVNARGDELRLLNERAVDRLGRLEQELGTNSRGNPRVMFSPARHGGAVGIKAVVEYERGAMRELFPPSGCDGGWCGG